MAAVLRSGKETLCLCVSFTLLYATLFQVQFSSCAAPIILKRVERAIPRPDYQTVAPLQLDEPLYGPQVPFLGELPKGLSVGNVIRIQGYIPEDLTEFQVNLCSNCSYGPLQLHIGVRFHQGVVVRNSYENNWWKSEERDGGNPFVLKREFVVLIEVDPEVYNIYVDGRLTWTFAHRVPYSSVENIEVKGGPVLIWRIDYTDKNTLSERLESQVENADTSGVAISVKENYAKMVGKFTMNLKWECTPQTSSNTDEEPYGGK